MQGMHIQVERWRYMAATQGHAGAMAAWHIAQNPARTAL
jgi:hypothetical protein